MSTKTEDKIAISSVEIQIAGTKLKLTLEQVAELKKILAKAFPDKETVYVPGPTRTIIERDYTWPFTRPYVPRLNEWDITCRSNDSTSATLCLATK